MTPNTPRPQKTTPTVTYLINVKRGVVPFLIWVMPFDDSTAFIPKIHLQPKRNSIRPRL